MKVEALKKKIMKVEALKKWMRMLESCHSNNATMEIGALDCAELLWFLKELKMLRERGEDGRE